ncbi:MAG: DUF885 family protein [Caulobacter sp.]|nr:DUF885 family protein [Caulobacter sp.]
MFKPFVFAVLLLVAPITARAAPADNAPMTGLIADYETWRAAEDPISAGQNGDAAALARLPDVTLAADGRRKIALEAFQARLKTIDPARLDDEGRLNHAFLGRVLEDQRQAIAFDTARLAFSSDDSWDGLLAYLAGTAPMTSRADAEAWLSRLTAMSGYYADNTDNARRGVATGFTQPRPIAEIVLAQARKAAAAPVETDSAVLALDRLPTSVTAAQKAAFKARAVAIVRDRLRPAQRAFVAFLEKDYLPAARLALGAATLTDGRAYYAWLARRYTTTDLTPDQIHQIGEAEVARIRAEMDGIRVETGFTGTHAAFLAFLRSDPRFYATSREDLLEKASEIAKRIDDQLPRFFGRLPRLPYGVRPVPAAIEVGYTTGRYFPGNPRLGVAGGYMVNTSALDQRALYELPALTLHEAVPGHHLQIALSQELEDVPAFRRDADMTAFTEGWGLYAERLGVEMGIYRTPYERFGRLSYEMWRACRLVADTGLHAMGWTREQARACFIDNSALSPLNIEVELDRYISWPGQALAYKIGEMKLVELRRRAEAALGERFDIRRFHDAVLLAGPLPLDLLETRIDAWIAVEKSKRGG